MKYPPGPSGAWLIGSYYPFKRDPLAFLTSLISRYGDVVRFRVGPRTYYYFQRPDHAQEVLLAGPEKFHRADAAKEIARALGDGLVTTDGKMWSESRRAVQPPFSERAVGAFHSQICDVVSQLLPAWQREVERSRKFNMTGAAFDLAMTVAAKSFVGIDVGNETRQLRTAIETLGTVIMNRIASAVRFPMWVPIPSHRAFARAHRTVDRIIYRAISRHRDDDDGADILSKLIRARIGAGRRALKDVEIRDQIATFFLAGFDTTAAALAIAMFLIANSPDVLRMVVSEVDSVVTGQVPTIFELALLTELRCAVLESLRLYPTVPLFSRIAMSPQQIGGYEIPRGTEVWISPYHSHRHAEYWTDAERFVPERWHDIPTHPLRLEKYLPFGKGPHTCIGATFALMEIQTVLATIFRTFTVAPVTTSIRPVAKIAMGTSEDIFVHLGERKTGNRIDA